MNGQPRERKRRRRSDSFTREMIRALAVLAVAVAVLLARGNPKIFNRIRSTLGIEVAESEVQTDTSGLTVEFMDVGQGDCTLVRSGGETMLIDTGDRDDGNRVINHLEEIGLRRIDKLVLTHQHADHIGEAAEMTDSFEVGEIIMPDVPAELLPESVSYDSLLNAAAAGSVEITRLKADPEPFDLGESTVSIYVSGITGEGAEDLNNWSLIVRITHGENGFLVTGDCEQPEEQQLLSRGVELSADVLRAGHHGSGSASGEDWLKAVAPRYGVISCGADNKYGHPHASTLSRLENVCEAVYITAETGSVTVTSDGRALSIDTEYDDIDKAA